MASAFLMRKYVLAPLAVVCAAIAAFFAFFGVQLVYTALTFDGEGSLGHVGMYIAALLYPFLAFIFAAFSFFAWRAAFSRSQHAPPRV
jgi:hypothetical protein